MWFFRESIVKNKTKMKKLTTILLLAIAINMAGQTKPVAQQESSSSDDINNSITGFAIVGAVYSATYEGFWQFTDIDPKKCKLIAVGTSILVNFGVSMLRKNYSQGEGYEYGMRPVQFNNGGGFVAAVSFPLLWGKEKRDRQRSLKNRKKLKHKHYKW